MARNRNKKSDKVMSF